MSAAQPLSALLQTRVLPLSFAPSLGVSLRPQAVYEVLGPPGCGWSVVTRSLVAEFSTQRVLVIETHKARGAASAPYLTTKRLNRLSKLTRFLQTHLATDERYDLVVVEGFHDLIESTKNTQFLLYQNQLQAVERAKQALAERNACRAAGGGEPVRDPSLFGRVENPVNKFNQATVLELLNLLSKMCFEKNSVCVLTGHLQATGEKITVLSDSHTLAPVPGPAYRYVTRQFFKPTIECPWWFQYLSARLVVYPDWGVFQGRAQMVFRVDVYAKDAARGPSPPPTAQPARNVRKLSSVCLAVMNGALHEVDPDSITPCRAESHNGSDWERPVALAVDRAESLAVSVDVTPNVDKQPAAPEEETQADTQENDEGEVLVTVEEPLLLEVPVEPEPPVVSPHPLPSEPLLCELLVTHPSLNEPLTPVLEQQAQPLDLETTGDPSESGAAMLSTFTPTLEEPPAPDPLWEGGKRSLPLDPKPTKKRQPVAELPLDPAPTFDREVEPTGSPPPVLFPVLVAGPYIVTDLLQLEEVCGGSSVLPLAEVIPDSQPEAWFGEYDFARGTDSENDESELLLTQLLKEGKSI